MQIRATDGLVNFYLPGYVKQGIGSSFGACDGHSVRAKFSDSNDQTIDAFRNREAGSDYCVGRAGSRRCQLDARANACRAIGILRGGAAVPDLIDALRTKDNRVMYEALMAMQKIRDPTAGPQIAYLLRDLDDSVQSAAIETCGLLRTKEALPALRDIVNNPRKTRSERAALAAMALMPEAQDRALLQRVLNSKDDKLRASAG